MRKINIIHVGNIKSQEKYFQDIIDEYTKRLSAEFKITNIEIKEEAGENAGKEGKKILEKVGDKTNSFKIALCIEGKKLSSEQFAKLLYNQMKPVDFIIGGPAGLSGEVKKSADYLLSLSDMTFSHRMARVMLAEQLYRAYSIETGRKYHK